MGQKSNQKSLRLGISQDWDAGWFSEKEYGVFLIEDFKIRQFLKNELSHSGLASIKIRRRSDKIEVIVSVARPGVVFGKGASNVDFLKKELEKHWSIMFLKPLMKKNTIKCSLRYCPH